MRETKVEGRQRLGKPPWWEEEGAQWQGIGEDKLESRRNVTDALLVLETESWRGNRPSEVGET